MNRISIPSPILILACGALGFFMAIILNHPPAWFVVANTGVGLVTGFGLDRFLICLASRKGK